MITYLKRDQKKYHLADKHIEVIRKNDVPGHIFLELTRKELTTKFKLPLGAAATIEKLIKKLIEIKPQKEDEYKAPSMGILII